jgi:hypothetical protein
MANLNFDQLFSEVNARRATAAEESRRKQEARLKEEYAQVTKVIAEAAAKNQNSCSVRNLLSEEILNAVRKHCKVTKWCDGVNPSTHDEYHVGWKFSW